MTAIVSYIMRAKPERTDPKAPTSTDTPDVES